MSRHSAQHSYGHRIQRIAANTYAIRWTVDRYIKGSRLRWPTGYERITDTSGAKRFARRWQVDFPN